MALTPVLKTARHSQTGFWAALFCVALLGSCSSFDTLGPKESNPAANDLSQGSEGQPRLSAEQKRLVSLFGGEYRSPQTEKYLNDILLKLVAVSDAPSTFYHVIILNSAAVNAFALPSGDLFITRGLLALANDSSEVAAVMAHEIAHVTARHAAQRAELEKKSAVISQAAAVIQSRERGDTLQATSRLTLASFSRQQELEADQIGVRMTANAGFDPFGASRFLVSLARSSELKAALSGQKTDNQEQPNLTSTHPSTPERISRAIVAARQIGAPGLGADGRSDYLAAINGMTFGDDTAEGIIRRQTFVHPRLGFGFRAPDGFVLENSSKAILGLAGGGAQAMRLDSVKIPVGQTLEQYLASGWIEGLQQSSIESITVNGLKAATASAKGGSWHFRLAAIRLNNDVYRLIFAVKILDSVTDEVFRRSIASFHALTSEEAGAAHPLRLVVVSAGPDATIDTLAARMVVPDRTIETFQLLNGLEAGQPIKVDGKYKIVEE